MKMHSLPHISFLNVYSKCSMLTSREKCYIEIWSCNMFYTSMFCYTTKTKKSLLETGAGHIYLFILKKGASFLVQHYSPVSIGPERE